MANIKEPLHNRQMEFIVDKLDKRDSSLKQAINRMLKEWRLDLDIKDADTDLDDLLALTTDQIINISIEDLLKYQWLLSKWALFISVQENKLNVNYKYDIKPLVEDSIKAEMIKIKADGTADERRQRVLSANNDLKELNLMGVVSQAYAETIHGLADRIADMKVTLNRVIDYKTYNLGFDKLNRKVRNDN